MKDFTYDETVKGLLIKNNSCDYTCDTLREALEDLCQCYGIKTDGLSDEQVATELAKEGAYVRELK